jgi:uncharacterized protein DUF935
MADLSLGSYPDPLSMPEAPNLEELSELADRVERVLSHRYTPFPVASLPEDWTVDKVRAARKLHDQGQFYHSMRLVRVVTTDPRVKSALSQRVDTPTGLPIRAIAAGPRAGTGASRVARDECEAMFTPRSYTAPPTIRRAILRDMVMVGVAIAQNVWTPRGDGERWDVRLEPWPLEHAVWNASINRYQVITTEGLLTIEHGHGKWCIFEPNGPRSWLLGAIRDLSMPWADRTYGIRYRSQHAAAHGSPVPVGELPQGIPIESAPGRLFQRLVSALLTMRIGGVRPFGSKIEYLEPKTQAWQVFDSIVRNSNEDISLSLLGQDGTVTKGGVYTAPAFDGIRFDLAELDTQTFEVGAQTGLVAPWAGVNFGVEYAPTISTVLPDPEEDERREAFGETVEAFGRGLVALRMAGLEVTDELVTALAREYGLPESMGLRLSAGGVPEIGAAPGAAPPGNTAPAESDGEAPAESGTRAA